MPLDPNRKTAKFKFGLNGMVSKEDPTLLTDGQYRSCSNLEVAQEGSLASRSGSKYLSNTLAGHDCYMIRKMTVSPSAEDPSTPSTNPRYIGVGGGTEDLWRTVNYTSFGAAAVATSINSGTAAAHQKAFSLANYAAGETGGPWAFIASEMKMLKDSGASPAATLPLWGVPPATGVATAAVIIQAAAATISSITYSYGDYVGVVITLAAPVSMSDFDQIVIQGVSGVSIVTTDGSTDINQNIGWAIRIGVPIPGGYGAVDPTTTSTMFRIYDSAGNSVTGSGAASGTMTAGPWGPGNVQTHFPAVGNLDGGAESSPADSTPYDYRFVFIDANSGNPGNPSQTMLTDSQVTNGVPAAVHLGQILVTVWGTGAALGSNYANLNQVKVYRRGGSLYDAWRLINQGPNPGLTGGAPAGWTFTDNAADADIVYNEQMETDNDMPVPSTVTSATGAKATISGPTGIGRRTVTVSAGSLSLVTPGTLLHCFFDAPEDIIVESVGVSTFVAYFQHSQPNGTTVQADAICGQPCNLAIPYQQFVIVAGDPNNPHLLYRSKGDEPEAYPVAPADGSVSTCACGTPANPIMNLYEFRGQILTLNLYSIYETLIYSGSLVPPAQMAERGTVGMRANCKTDNEIWFLSTDGVWSWDGSTCRKRSEAIDPIFHGQEFNGMLPLDYNSAAYNVMAYRRGQVHLLYYYHNQGYHELICEPAFGDRWRKYDFSATNIPSFLFTEPDTASMIKALPQANTIEFILDDQYVVSGGVDYTADGISSAAAWLPPASYDGGTSIPFDMVLPWFDMGSPASKKLFEEVLLELDTSGSGPSTGISGQVPSLSVDVLFDFSDIVNAETMTITVPIPTSGGGRTVISLLPSVSAAGDMQSYGQEAKAISYHIYGSAWPTQMQFYSLTLVYQDTELLTSGAPSDWTDLGYPHDKRLYQMVVTFDTEGIDQTVVLDTMTGVDGNTYTAAVQTFTLSNVQIAGAGRAKKSFPLKDALIAKMVRLRQVSAAPAYNAASTVLFKIFSVEFPEMEQYPPDIVSATPWEDDGYPYLKYINQATLVVDTGVVPVVIQIQADGVTVSTQTVLSAEADRDRNLTIPPNITGRRWRIYVDTTQTALKPVTAGGLGGKFQLWNAGKIFRFQPADKGEVGHTFDWDDLGHPWDKYLKSVTIEYDTTTGGAITLQMDTITGIGGATVNTSVAHFTLGVGRGKTEFPIAADTVAKMVRLYPTTSPNVGYKQWKYTFDKVDYPCDTVLSTEWRNAESPNDKNPSWLSIDADTNNVACTVELQNENGTVMTVSHTGKLTDRMRNYPIQVDLFAKMWRLVVIPGTGGKFQLFSWTFSRWQPTPQSSGVEPPDAVLWTPWVEAGSLTDKNPSWLEIDAYTNGAPIAVALVNENGTVMIVNHTGTLTNHAATYPIQVDIFGKMWRLITSLGSGAKFQLWNWGFKRWQPTPQASEVDPPEIVLWTPWTDCGYSYPKLAKNLILTINTGGVACVVALETSDGGIKQNFNVSTTYINRNMVVACNPELDGLMWRLLLTPGSNGLAQLWDWKLDNIKEPPAVTQWSSYQNSLGYIGYKILVQYWMEYKSAVPIVVTLKSSTGTFTVTLPAHSTRMVERGLFPSTFGAGLNKSVLFSVLIASSDGVTTFSLYGDSSGIEYVPQGAERHADFTKVKVSEFMSIPL